ncbi:MGMT family protein [Paraconexibacter sp.]|uniref:MGMT family protein n=1 Tax=Paraconexibacter sp. TaxID=2949640 RepID=UPI0035623262
MPRRITDRTIPRAQAGDRIALIRERARRVPPGFVTTYGDLCPDAPRLAGTAMRHAGDHDVPWWRVVRSDGSLAVGARQRALLQAEDVPFRAGGERVDLRAARLPPEVL